MRIFVTIYFVFISILLPGLVYAQSYPGGVQNNLAFWLRTDNNLIQAGGGVYTWIDINDPSKNPIQTVASSRPDVLTNRINGHSVIQFDGVQQWLQFDDAAEALSGPCSIFMVVTPQEDNDVGYYLTSNIGNSNLLKFGHKLSGELIYDNTMPTMWPYNMHEQESLVAFQAEQNFYMNAQVNGEGTLPWTFNFQNSGADGASLGKASSLLGIQTYWKGEIAEIIIYDRFLSNSELNDVQSYLNIRYGITIPVANHNFYSHTAYSNNIAGIGQNTQLLYQSSSRNVNDGNIVRLQSPNDLDNDEYLVWGNDGNSTNVINTETPAVVLQRIEREWRVSEVGEVGLATVSFDLDSLGYGNVNDPSDFALLIDSDDGDFSNANIQTTGVSLIGNEIIFTGVDLSDGDWFTLGVALAPCNTSNFSLTSGPPYANQPVTFEVDTPDPLATYSWSFSGGATPATATGASASTTWNLIGNFSVELTISYPHCGDNITINSFTVEPPAPECVDIILNAWLEGPYNEDTDMMDTGLNDRGMLPGQTPASSLPTPTPAGQPYGIAPWFYFSSIGDGWTDLNYTSDAVDWIMVSFRLDANDIDTEVARGVGLITSNGEIEMEDECILEGSGSLHIVIEHRNHVAVMTEEPIPIVNGEIFFDFRTANNNLTTGQKVVETGNWALYAGDGSQINDLNGYDVNGDDKTLWDDVNGTFYIYHPADYNLNGDVDGADKNLWLENNGVSSQIDRN